jgi:phosphoribosylaminoimidazolecarboxamide formyltransferase / IMP cyclohydrolase
LKKIQTALISVFHKDGLEQLVMRLHELGVKIISTGGTHEFINSLGINATAIENMTDYPSILGGRVKTLHPKVFGGILGRPSLKSDQEQMDQYNIPPIDLVVVDLYPFEETVKSTVDPGQIIEKIDIGGISLIRAAAKNFEEVLVIPSSAHYPDLMKLLNGKNGCSELSDRQYLAACAFAISSHYDTAIFNWMNQGRIDVFRKSSNHANVLRYGENPQQKGTYYGKMDELFEQLNGKALSYNNLLDLDAGLSLLAEFTEPTFAILKHNNACGLASRATLNQAYEDALAGDPVSAFGGVLVCNRLVDDITAQAVNNLFFEVIAAPDYEKNALQLLRTKKNRIILHLKDFVFPVKLFKSVLNGILEQDRDLLTGGNDNFQVVTQMQVQEEQVADLVFANKIVKHTRSNAIVLAKNRKLLGSGIGQTSRVDALKQAISKAKESGFNLKDAVLASDAFFPFADSVEIAANEGISAIVQPGGSIRDQDSIAACNKHGMCMVFTGMRHFKH